jgi:hypothetical protein
MLGSLLGVLGDVVKVAVAPVVIAANVTRAITKPIAEAADELVKETKSLLKD